MGWRYYYLETQNKIRREHSFSLLLVLSRGISPPSISFRVSFPPPSTTFSTRESARGERFANLSREKKVWRKFLFARINTGWNSADSPSLVPPLVRRQSRELFCNSKADAPRYRSRDESSRPGDEVRPREISLRLSKSRTNSFGYEIFFPPSLFFFTTREIRF